MNNYYTILRIINLLIVEITSKLRKEYFIVLVKNKYNRIKDYLDGFKTYLIQIKKLACHRFHYYLNILNRICAHPTVLRHRNRSRNPILSHIEARLACSFPLMRTHHRGTSSAWLLFW